MLAKISIDKKGEGRISSEDIKAIGIASESHVEAEIVIRKNHKERKPFEIPPEKTLQDI